MRVVCLLLIIALVCMSARAFGQESSEETLIPEAQRTISAIIQKTNGKGLMATDVHPIEHSAVACISRKQSSDANSDVNAPDSVRSPRPIGFSPAFRSIQVDGVTSVISTGWGGSVDFDLLVPTVTRQMTVGLRAGAGWQLKNDLAGSRNQRMCYDLLGRVSSAGKIARFDLLLGVEWEGPRVQSLNEEIFKVGVELRLKLLSNVAGLMLKASGSRNGGVAGLGLFLGLDQY